MRDEFSALAAISYRLSAAHRLILDSTSDLSQTELTRVEALTVPPIAFHLWHIARWTDRSQSLVANAVHESISEVWSTENLAGKWNLNGEGLGEAESGMGMDDHLASAIDLPMEEVRDYTERVMGLLEKRLSQMNEADLSTRTTDLYGRDSSIGTALLSHLTHIDRHLGMIEALRGVSGLKGTATV